MYTRWIAGILTAFAVMAGIYIAPIGAAPLVRDFWIVGNINSVDPDSGIVQTSAVNGEQREFVFGPQTYVGTVLPGSFNDVQVGSSVRFVAYRRIPPGTTAVNIFRIRILDPRLTPRAGTSGYVGNYVAGTIASTSPLRLVTPDGITVTGYPDKTFQIVKPGDGSASDIAPGHYVQALVRPSADGGPAFASEVWVWEVKPD